MTTRRAGVPYDFTSDPRLNNSSASSGLKPAHKKLARPRQALIRGPVVDPHARVAACSLDQVEVLPSVPEVVRVPEVVPRLILVAFRCLPLAFLHLQLKVDPRGGLFSRDNRSSIQ